MRISTLVNGRWIIATKMRNSIPSVKIIFSEANIGSVTYGTALHLGRYHSK